MYDINIPAMPMNFINIIIPIIDDLLASKITRLDTIAKISQVDVSSHYQQYQEKIKTSQYSTLMNIQLRKHYTLYSLRRNYSIQAQRHDLTRQQVAMLLGHQNDSTQQFRAYGDTYEDFDLVGLLHDKTDKTSFMNIDPYLNGIRSTITDYKKLLLTKQEKKKVREELESDEHVVGLKKITAGFYKKYGKDWKLQLGDHEFQEYEKWHKKVRHN
ncbi:unnamed protein product [Absidia cylindrospora]